MNRTLTTAKTIIARIGRFFASFDREGRQDWDRAYLCSMAPTVADTLRHTEDAERHHPAW